jgi:hypothetical protein
MFDLGMRADWILTDEERMNKRLKIEENRRLRQMLYPDSPEIITVGLNKYNYLIYSIFYSIDRQQ